jgi:hypothetical protein
MHLHLLRAAVSNHVFQLSLKPLRFRRVLLNDISELSRVVIQVVQLRPRRTNVFPVIRPDTAQL